MPVFHSDTPEVKLWGLERLQARIAHLDKLLSQRGGHFLLGGDRPSVADLYLYVVIGWSSLCNLNLASHGAVRAHRDRVGALDFVREAQARMALDPDHV